MLVEQSVEVNIVMNNDCKGSSNNFVRILNPLEINGRSLMEAVFRGGRWLRHRDGSLCLCISGFFHT